jgi:hypothetical protein
MLVPDQITRDGNPINSTNNTVVVGQQINLTNMISGVLTNAITSYQWHIPGANNTTNDPAFYDYQPSATNSCYTNLFTPTNYTTNSFIQFYWSSAGTNQVSCTTVIYGKTSTVAATLNVLRPTSSLTASTTTTSLQTDNPRLPRVIFADVLGGTNGIIFTGTVSAPAPFTGTNVWNQIVNNDVEQVRSPLTSFQIQSSGYDGTKNNWYPYQEFVGANPVDSPGQGLFSFETNNTRQFTATMYLMWKADTNSVNGDKTVAVPLRSWQWNWGYTVTNAAPSTNGTSAWGIQASTNYPSYGLTNVDETNEPTWSTNEAFNRVHSNL